jgi:hypothetical protein
MQEAADLSYITILGFIWDPKHQETYEYYKAFRDLNDKVAIAKPKNDPVCHVNFSPLVPWNPLDHLQAQNLFHERVGDSDCVVRQGFYRSVFTVYYPLYRQAIDDCRNTCVESGGEPCPLILSGLSAGGASAVVAAIDLREMNPLTLNLGGMRTIVLKDDDEFPCNDIDRNRQFRFVNTKDENHHDYDMIATQQYLPNVYHVGHSVFLDDTNYPMAYTGLNDNLERRPRNIWIHLVWHYQDRMQQIMDIDEQCYPIPVGSWPLEHNCGYDDECGSFQSFQQGYCVNGVCQESKLSLGVVCEEDNACSSGYCERPSWNYWFGIGNKQCVVKLATGEWCDEDHECQSGACERPVWYRAKQCQ